MSKIDLDPITSGYNLSKINANFQKIEDTLNKEVLYRKEYLGEPNEMQTNLDMNGKQILNVTTGTSDGSLVTKGYVDQGLSLKFDKSGGPISGSVNMSSNEITNVSRLSTDTLEIDGVPVVPTDLAIYYYNETREALRRSYAEAGYNLVEGSFEAGGTLVNANDVLLQERTGKAFSGPAGTVAAGTNPASGGFVDKSGTSASASAISNANGGSVQDFIDRFFDDVQQMVAYTNHVLGTKCRTGATTWRVINTPVTSINDFISLNGIWVSDFGVIADGVNDDTIAFVTASKHSNYSKKTLKVTGDVILNAASVNPSDIVTVSGQPYVLCGSIAGEGDCTITVDGNIGFLTDGVQSFKLKDLVIYTLNRALDESNNETDGSQLFRNMAPRIISIYENLNIYNDVPDLTGEYRAPVSVIEYGGTNILKINNVRLSNAVGFIKCINAVSASVDNLKGLNIGTLMYFRNSTTLNVNDCDLINTVEQQFKWVGRTAASPKASNGLDLIQTELCGSVNVSNLTAINPIEYCTYIQAARVQISDSNCQNASGFKAVGTNYANPCKKVYISNCHVDLDTTNLRTGVFCVQTYCADNVLIEGCSGKNHTDTTNELSYFYSTTNIYGWTNKHVTIRNNRLINGNWLTNLDMQPFTAAKLAAIDPLATFLICDDLNIYGNYHKKANNSLFGMLFNIRDNDGSPDAKATYAAKGVKINGNECDLKVGGLADPWLFDVRYVDGITSKNNTSNLPFNNFISKVVPIAPYKDIKMEEPYLKFNGNIASTLSDAAKVTVLAGTDVNLSAVKSTTVTKLNLSAGANATLSTGAKKLSVEGKGYWQSQTGLDAGIQMTANGDFYVGKLIGGVKTDQVGTPPVTINVSAGNIEIRGDLLPTVNYYVDMKIL